VPSALLNPPELFPRFPFVIRLHRDQSVLRKRGSHFRGGENREQSGEMRVVTGDEDVASLRAQAVANPLGRIFGLKVACGGEGRERVAGTPECLGRLTRAQFAAMPHHVRARAARRGFARQTGDVLATLFGKWTARIDVGAYRIAMVHKKKSQV